MSNTQSIWFPIGLPQGVPIPANPPAVLPLTGGELMLLNQNGITVQTELENILPVATPSYVEPFEYNVIGSSVLLSAAYNMHLINNLSGGAITVNPPANIPLNWLCIIQDYSGTAGTMPITFNGTVNGESMPELIYVKSTWAQMFYFSAGLQFVRFG